MQQLTTPSGFLSRYDEAYAIHVSMKVIICLLWMIVYAAMFIYIPYAKQKINCIKKCLQMLATLIGQSGWTI